MPIPENPVQHKISRAQSLREYMRDQTVRLEAGEIPALPTREGLRLQFGYAYPYEIDRILRRRKGGAVPQRAKDLKAVVTQEIEDLGTGMIERLSTTRELAEKLGYDNLSGLTAVLRYAGLSRQRRQLIENPLYHKLTPSSEGAWLVGILAGGGHVSKIGTVTLASEHKELLQVFKSRGERVFGLNAHQDEYSRLLKNGKVYTRAFVEFNNRRDLRRTLGDLGRSHWADTVTEKHRWIIDRPRYMWSFLEGFFEVRGYVIPNYSSLSISTTSVEAANFLTELLVRVGLDKPSVTFLTNERERVTGVAITNLEDARQFARNIKSSIPELEAKLERVRNRQRFKVGRPSQFSDEQVIIEYVKARDLLSHPPTTIDLRRFTKEGVISCSFQVFINRFGEGSFLKARENLERITEERRAQQS